MMVAPNVNNTSGISSAVDGFRDFFGQIGQTIGGGVVTGVNSWVNRELAERFPPQDFSNGSTGSPKDTAVNEVRAAVVENNAQNKNNMQMYILYGLAAVAALGAVVYIARR